MGTGGRENREELGKKVEEDTVRSSEFVVFVKTMDRPSWATLFYILANYHLLLAFFILLFDRIMIFIIIDPGIHIPRGWTGLV